MSDLAQKQLRNDRCATMEGDAQNLREMSGASQRNNEHVINSGER